MITNETRTSIKKFMGSLNEICLLIFGGQNGKEFY